MTKWPYEVVLRVSALPPRADMGAAVQYVCLVPRADIEHAETENMSAFTVLAYHRFCDHGRLPRRSAVVTLVIPSAAT